MRWQRSMLLSAVVSNKQRKREFVIPTKEVLNTASIAAVLLQRQALGRFLQHQISKKSSSSSKAAPATQQQKQQSKQVKTARAANQD